MATSLKQPDLFNAVQSAYQEAQRPLSNAELYQQVAHRLSLPDEALQTREPVGKQGAQRNLLKRAIRWQQQTLKSMGVLEHTSNKGIWQLAERTNKELDQARPGTRLLAFSTRLGLAIWGEAAETLAGLDQPIVLCLTSLPYPLTAPRSYGNPKPTEYIDFALRVVEPVVRQLAPGGNICLNVGNDIFQTGSPARTTYVERLSIALEDHFGLAKMDTLIWENPARPPGPLQWASLTRQQLNATYEPILWFTNDAAQCRADNRRVLKPHTKQHLDLQQRGGEQRSTCYGDGAHRVSPGSYALPTAGSIPRNVIRAAHTCTDTFALHRAAKALGMPAHGAMWPSAIPSFLIELLSDVGDLVVDMCAGTARTGLVAERLGRRWICIEKVLQYLRTGAELFRDRDGFWLHPQLASYDGQRQLQLPI